MNGDNIEAVGRGGLTAPLRGQPARVHHGRPVTVGPAVCEACRQLVWWSGALWSNQDGTWHRCAIVTEEESRCRP